MTVSKREEEYFFSVYKELKRYLFAELATLPLLPEKIIYCLCIFTVAVIFTVIFREPQVLDLLCRWLHSQ